MARDTSPTERRGYERPPIGDDWADAWDGLVEDSDELAVERGPIADRPSTGAYDDALYLAVDQRTLWRWDAAASDWEAAAGLGTASDPVPGTSHFESVSTESATYANSGFDFYDWELVDTFFENLVNSGGSSPITYGSPDTTAYELIGIVCRVGGESGESADLRMTHNNAGAGDYDYTLRDEQTGAYSEFEDEDDWLLLSPAASKGGHIAMLVHQHQAADFSNQSDPQFGTYGGAVRGERAVYGDTDVNGSIDNFTLSLESGRSLDVRLYGVRE